MPGEFFDRVEQFVLLLHDLPRDNGVTTDRLWRAMTNVERQRANERLRFPHHHGLEP